MQQIDHDEVFAIVIEQELAQVFLLSVCPGVVVFKYGQRCGYLLRGYLFLEAYIPEPECDIG